MSIFFDILHNLGLIVSFSIISAFAEFFIRKDVRKALLQGFLLGTGALIGMLSPLVVAPGLIFDGRSILISIAALYFGPVAGGVAVVMAAALRIFQGGPGMVTGILVITWSAVLGILLHIRRRKSGFPIPFPVLYAFGLAVHAGMLLLMFTLPGNLALSTLRNIGLPVIVLYPLATLAVGQVINFSFMQKGTLESLAKSEERIRSLSNNIQDGMLYQVIAFTNGFRTFTYLSDAVNQLYGITPEQGMDDASLIYRCVHPDDIARLTEEENVAIQTLSTFRSEVRMREPNGTYRWSSFVSTPKHLDDGTLLWDGIEFVITERKQNEERIAQSLREKETLLRELYHRTKNTMQVIRGILVLQASEYPDNRELAEVVRNTEERIQAISLVHQMLYQNQDISRISIRSYIAELSGLILKGGDFSDRITLKTDIDDQYFLLDTAVPFGMIINELMTNSLKYAFPGGRKGIISISLHNTGDTGCVLDYADDGVGVPPGFDFRNQSTLGLRLIHSIGEHQMRGRVSMTSRDDTAGVRATVEFASDVYTDRV